MKSKVLYISVNFILSLCIGIIFFNACSKDESELITRDSDFLKITSFKDRQEYFETLNSILSMSPEELKEYEESKGYKSFGRLCDEFYQTINPEDFQSLEEIKEFVNKNSEYVKLVMDDYGEYSLESALSSNPNRYLINKDKMFIVNKNIFKVFEDATIAVDIDKKALLSVIKDDNYWNCSDNDNYRFMPINTTSSQLKDATNNCGTFARCLRTDKPDRLLLEISISYYDDYDINGYPMTICQSKVFVKPQKKSIVWLNCKRTISCNIKLAIDTETTSGWKREFVYHTYNGTSPRSNYTYVIAGGVVSIGEWARYNMHFGGIKSTASIPDLNDCPDGPAKIECNTHLF